ncbi:unnamed protein product [Eruca vesicaria subsp. sativa]|uniref:Uncharacterized protein n=1 Tax=Eruca vesicaria subsp. sativa TaxID=29727 RepID=A0ABC8J8T9_ERUVS|nr:unnamed protein product [Eruca vesicaria subsp. sativa]
MFTIGLDWGQYWAKAHIIQRNFAFNETGAYQINPTVQNLTTLHQWSNVSSPNGQIILKKYSSLLPSSSSSFKIQIEFSEKMTSTEHTETLNAPELQIWNNAAFDDGDSNLTSAIEASSWSNNLNSSFDSDCSKENQIPLSVSSSLKSSVSFSTTDDPIRKVKEKPHKTVKAKNVDNIDAEIEEVEKEINRLSTKLESLRLEKAEQIARSIAIRGRIVPAKFMESQKQTVKFDTAGSKSRATPRRGVSLGPGEIYSAAKKSETTVTPLQSAQNRRKSCFFKLPGIEEGKAATKPKMTATAQKKAATTGGLKRGVKKEENVLASIQPKRLFKEEEKRKVVKPGRVVASRYSLVNKTGERDVRKRSLSENEEKENQRLEKRRASDENRKSEGRVKKRWEIPSEVEVFCSGVSDETPLGKELPKIRTLRGRVGESPRDSGAAKRVSELESKNRDFTFCQLLRFEE